MRWIGQQTNVDSPDGEYTYGKIRDWNSTTPGTPVDEALYGDIHQLMAKMMQESTIIPNNLPDNDYNGYQLWKALTQHMGGYSKKIAFSLTQSGTGSPTLQNWYCNTFGNTITTMIRTATGRYEIYFSGTPFNPTTNFHPHSVILQNGETVSIVWQGTNQFNIYTRNASGTAADSLLNDTLIVVEQFQETL